MTQPTVCRVLAIMFVASAAGDIGAQRQTGNLYGRVLDPKGAALPGVTMTLTEPGKLDVQVTNTQGEFQVLNLQPGTYPIRLQLQGFTTIEYPAISIDADRTTTIEITMGASVGSVIPLNLNSSVRTAQGLETITFDTLHGRVIVNLPDDVSSGDRISGTVIAEPKGQTSDERSRNQVALQGYVVDLAGRPMSSWNSRPRSKTGADEATPDRLTASVESTLESNAKAARLILKDNNGNEVGQAVIATPSISPISRSATAPTSGQFQLPTLGQQGHPIQIVGPFDGLSTNTTLTWSHVVTPAQDVGRSPDAAAGSLWLMAESPRKSVFESPTNVTGPVELILKEKSAETKGVYRNVGVSLTAPKTELLKGESTTLTIRVIGLQGIAQGMPLHLVKGGVVRMEGGDNQTKTIKPDEVKRDGTYTTTLKLTGQQAGAFSVNATVVVFDVCLQDSNGNALVLSADTGDYLFCPAQSRSPATGLGIATRSGCTITIQPVNSENHAQVQVDLCARQGSATVQIGSGRKTFTITDRDMRNNTCTCK